MFISRYCYDKGVVLQRNKENLSANLNRTDHEMTLSTFTPVRQQPDVGQTRR